MKDGNKNIYPEDKDIHNCKNCGEPKVIQKPGSSYVPKYCKACLPIVRRSNAKKGRKKLNEIQREEELNKLEEVVAPTGEKLYLDDIDEKKYYNLRKDAYLSDFGLITAADTTLLSRLLTLEIECRRIEKKLQSKLADKWLQESLYKATEQIRRVQQDLGITRKERQHIDNSRKPSEIIRDLIEKFNDYRENNKDDFIWICSKCGERHILNRKRENWKSLNEKKVVNGEKNEKKV